MSEETCDVCGRPLCRAQERGGYEEQRKCYRRGYERLRESARLVRKADAAEDRADAAESGQDVAGRAVLDAAIAYRNEYIGSGWADYEKVQLAERKLIYAARRASLLTSSPDNVKPTEEKS